MTDNYHFIVSCVSVPVTLTLTLFLNDLRQLFPVFSYFFSKQVPILGLHLFTVDVDSLFPFQDRAACSCSVHELFGSVLFTVCSLV